MTIRVFTAAIGLGTAFLLLGADEEPRQRVQVSKTERVDFPSGGTLRLKNSIGTLTVEAWDRPEVEITIIKSTKYELDARGRKQAPHELERVHVATDRQGDELVVTTDFPRNRAFPPPLYPKPEVNFALEYRIKAPANARIIDEHHDVGEVNIDGLTGDIDVNLLQGEIFLHLPENGQYDIHAKSDFGNVNSDFPGLETRRWWRLGHQSENGNSAAPHKLNLRVGFGDIVVLKMRAPKAPDSLFRDPRPEGL